MFRKTLLALAVGAALAVSMPAVYAQSTTSDTGSTAHHRQHNRIGHAGSCNGERDSTGGTTPTIAPAQRRRRTHNPPQPTRAARAPGTAIWQTSGRRPAPRIPVVTGTVRQSQ